MGDWQAWAEYPAEPADRPPMVLAGGLTADNVAEAIRVVKPAAVDAASGVEISPGRKSLPLVLRFVAAARKALGLAVIGSPPCHARPPWRIMPDWEQAWSK